MPALQKRTPGMPKHSGRSIEVKQVCHRNPIARGFVPAEAGTENALTLVLSGLLRAGELAFERPRELKVRGSLWDLDYPLERR